MAKRKTIVRWRSWCPRKSSRALGHDLLNDAFSALRKAFPGKGFNVGEVKMYDDEHAEVRFSFRDDDGRFTSLPRGLPQHVLTFVPKGTVEEREERNRDKTVELLADMFDRPS